ncbi:MAG TPA: universal stress protein [Acidimicrobiia bacterium]|jgi:nucleotide-binding universal stress UspA family protein|nr:universal stress protein [Acidimicrobiia bacterium]
MSTVLPERVSTVVVALDASESSERAVPVGARLAARLHARLLPMSAVPKETAREERCERLQRLIPRSSGAAIEVVVDPDPADAIDIVLRGLEDAIACLGTHGRGRTAALLGSVTTELMRRRREPVVLVGPNYRNELTGRGLVACIDETPQATEIIPVALHWSKLLGERLTVITVAEAVPPALTSGPVRRKFGPNDDVDGFLRHAVAKWRAQGYDLDTEAVYDPISPASGLTDYLWAHPSTLVVLGSRARTGIERAIFGSVAAQMMHRSLAPVLAVPRSDAQ